MHKKKRLESCVRAYRDDPNQARRDDVVRVAEPLIRSILSRISTPSSMASKVDELYNAGVIAILQALDSYDPKKGASFATHAYGRVFGEMIDYLRRIDPLPRRRRAKVALVSMNRERLAQELSAEPDDRQVAERSLMTLPEYHTVLQDATRRSDISLLHPVKEETDMRLLDVVPDLSGLDTLRQFEDDQLHDYLRDCVDSLDEREKTVLTLYFDGEMTLSAIGDVIGVSEARVSQLRKRALRTLLVRIDPELRWAA